jgi:Fe/S biogenesis protein NfuA
MADVTAVLEVTEKARKRILEIRAAETDPETLGLWLEVSGAKGGDYSYDMWFQPIQDASEVDVVQPHDDLTVVIPASSVDRLRGATLDLSRDLLNPGMVIINPNKPPSLSPAVGASRPPADLSGDVAQRVHQVLEQQINPSIASHGGRAELVAVEEDIAYVRLSGGCQGCGMASVTLGQGIEVAIKDAVPEILQVVDTTDHASGANPYYEPSKK